MGSQREEEATFFFNGGRDIECDMYSQGPLAIFLSFLFPSSSWGVGIWAGVPESPDRESLASCAVFGVQERDREKFQPWIARKVS